LHLKGDTVQEKLDALDAARRIYWPTKEDGKPRLKWYVDELEGVAIPDVWMDIDPIPAQAAERLGYPTQKPEPLLQRIVRRSNTGPWASSTPAPWKKRKALTKASTAASTSPMPAAKPNPSSCPSKAATRPFPNSATSAASSNAKTPPSAC